MISPGEKIDLNLRFDGVCDGVAKQVRLGDLLTRRTIISVYMKNNTPSCDRQNDSLRAHASEFDRAGFNVIALSRNTCGSHARYAADKNIGYILLSDPNDQFARATDSLVEKSMYGKKFIGPVRAAYIVDRDGTVLAVAEKVDPAQHAEQLRALIATI